MDCFASLAMTFVGLCHPELVSGSAFPDNGGTDAETSSA